MSEEWGPWVEHDGSRPDLPYPCFLCVACEGRGTTPGDGAAISSKTPNWYWRWRIVSTGRLWWKESQRVRVCDNPEYAPIIAYRIRKPRGMAILQEIAEGVREPETVE